MAGKRKRKGPDEAADRLYGLPPDDFTAARNELARDLRSDGDGAAAQAVRALRKPTAAAHAINQGVRADPKAAAALVRAGKALPGAQGDKLRAAMAKEAEALDAMMAAVESAAGDVLLSKATLDRARETLRAVASDEELRGAFEAGRVTRDHEAVGFGSLTTLPQRPSSDDEAEAAARRDAKRALKQAETALAKAGKKVAAKGRAAGRARTALEKAEGELEEAEADRRERAAAVKQAKGR